MCSGFFLEEGSETPLAKGSCELTDGDVNEAAPVPVRGSWDHAFQ
jgi:hypothetical protein